MFFENTFCFIGLLFKIVCGSFACFICHLEIFPNKNYIKVIFKIDQIRSNPFLVWELSINSSAGMEIPKFVRRLSED